LKNLQKFGPGCIFYGFGNESELDELEGRLSSGERVLALFCEFPSNPLLVSPDMARISQLAERYDFAVVVDESIGNFLNVNVLPYADVIVSSLTKLFSGDSNVMGGRYVTRALVCHERVANELSAVLNPKGRIYRQLKQTWDDQYEDNYWAEDAIVMERNSRDFVSRSDRINRNAEAICDLLLSHPKGRQDTMVVSLLTCTVKAVYYPKHSESRHLFDRCRNEEGGYGGLLSATFYTKSDAVKFFDVLRTSKGPSLGTNFTLR
jgi:cystathionine gamma-synthase